MPDPQSNRGWVLRYVRNGTSTVALLGLVKYAGSAWQVLNALTLFFGEAVTDELLYIARVIERGERAALRVRDLASRAHDVLKDRREI